ncbi:MAG TPA: CRTAC1 family protein [Planctomycetota bacterium]|nr:CRTAC1 family protein [Planctomycetota bacterium]
MLYSLPMSCFQGPRWKCLAGFLALVPAAIGSTGRAEEVFTDVTEKAGIRFVHVNGAAGDKHLYETMSGGGGWLDFDGDGNLDLYLVQGHGDSRRAYLPGKEANVLYRNRGDGTFEDVTEKAGVGDRRYGSGLAVGDIDNDGDTDLYVTNYGQNVLYLNEGNGTFRDVTEEAGVGCTAWSTSAAFLDINQDGLLDLYVATYIHYDPRVHKACTGNPRKIPGYCHPNKFDGAPDFLYLNLGEHRFQDISKSSGVAVSGRILSKGLGVLPTDFDGNGLVDIFVANDSTPDFLWRNLGGGKFQDAAVEAGVAFNSDGKATASMGIDGGDVNGDGLFDYMVTNFAQESDSLFLAEGGGFYTEAASRTGIAEITFNPLGFGMKLLDHDLDGDLDIYVARGHILDNVEVLHPGSGNKFAQPDQLLENDGKGFFRDVSRSSGAWFHEAHVGRGAAFADYDNDGDIDIFVVNLGARGVLLENRRPSGAHWVGFELRGSAPSSRGGEGSLLQVKVTGRELPVPLEVRTAGSYLASNDHRQVVGLGRDGRPEWVRVRWPDGLVEVFERLQRDAYNRLERGTGRAAR